MIVTLEIPAASRRQIERQAKTLDNAPAVMRKALHAAVVVGAEEIRDLLVTEQLGLSMQHPGSGLAASLMGWMISDELGAVGVPGNSPAARYAGILEHGGTIYPKTARALAVPVHPEAKNYTSPRDMPGLFLLKREGKAPVLARSVGGDAIEVMWVLLASVTIPPFGWLSKGADRTKGDMAAAFQDVVNRAISQAARGSGNGD